MAGNPFLSKFFDDVDQGNRSQLNRLAARAMGVEAATVGAAVMFKPKSRSARPSARLASVWAAWTSIR